MPFKARGSGNYASPCRWQVIIAHTIAMLKQYSVYIDDSDKMQTSLTMNSVFSRQSS